MILKLKFFLLSFIIFFIIIIITINLFAQEKKTRDPFLSLGDKIRLSQETKDISILPYPIILNGIIWTKNSPIAIINDEIVQEGEVWRDFKVEEIQKNKVILSKGDSKFEIPLVTEEEKEENEAKKY
jgi:hypothetical protein